MLTLLPRSLRSSRDGSVLRSAEQGPCGQMMIAIIQRRSAGKPRESHGPIGPGCLGDLLNPAVDLSIDALLDDFLCSILPRKGLIIIWEQLRASRCSLSGPRPALYADMLNQVPGSLWQRHSHVPLC
jgi:hypothetical protein